MENGNFLNRTNDSCVDKTENKKIGFGKSVLLYLHDLSYLIAVMMVLFLLVFRVVIVSGSSMESTLIEGDYVLLLGSGLYSDPEPGDVIVASKDTFDNGVPVVKRVIAVEGQTVRIEAGTNHVYVDNQLLSEPYIYNQADYTYFEDIHVTVGKDQVFVMGDHRSVSCDSRSERMGLLEEREILGKAVFLFLPGHDPQTNERDFDRFGGLD